MRYITIKRLLSIIGLALLLLSSCSPSEEELRATDTKIAAEVFGTQTAAAPKATNTFTPSPSPTSTRTPIPTRNWTATAIIQATSEAQSMANLIQELYSEGHIKSTQGQFYPMEDFYETWAQINWFQWWSSDLNLNDVVIRSDIGWASAGKGANISTSGCGFVFGIDEEKDNYYVAYLALDGNATLLRKKNGRLTRIGTGYHGKIDYLRGEAELMITSEGGTIQIFVDGEKAFSRANQSIFEGDIGYTLLSGINTDFGTRCSFNDTQIWGLDQ